MKKVMQTKFGEHQGNCFAACIASLLPVELDDIPDFSVYEREWFFKFDEWLHQFDLCALFQTRAQADLPDDCYYMIGGKSTRGIMHSVIGRNGVMVHDPHPDGSGLTEILDYILFVRMFDEPEAQP